MSRGEDAEDDEVVELERAAEAGEQDDAPAGGGDAIARILEPGVLCAGADHAPAIVRCLRVFECCLRCVVRRGYCNMAGSDPRSRPRERVRREANPRHRLFARYLDVVEG